MLVSLFWRIVNGRITIALGMHIVAIGWIYVVLMMALAEQSVVAGMMTFLMYGAIPLSILLYITGSGRRKRNRAAAEKRKQEAFAPESAPLPAPAPGTTSTSVDPDQ